MRFSLGFTADEAATQTQDSETASSMLQVRQPVGLTKLGGGPGSRHSTPPVLTSRPILDTVEASSSSEGEEEEGEEEQDNKKSGAANKSSALPRQRSTRSKTVFQFAHPVATRRRLKLRLKLLLQLHEINRSSRPFPKYDVLPADVPTRLICKLPKPYGNTRAFGARDMVVVTSDMYEQQSLSTSDDRSISSEESCVEQREVVATICQTGSDDSPRKSKFEIAFSSGPSWEGTSLPNGSYELVSKGGTAPSRKVRWVARDKKPVRQGTGLSAITVANPGRFTFSVINPNTRQHPVIASMTRKGLTVFDQFSYPASEEQSPPGSPSTTSTKSSAERDRGLVSTDEELRKVIVMTGIWVAFMEGWSSKSPLSGGDSANRTDSPLSPRSRSSTFLSADGDIIAESVTSLSGRPSRWNSKKVMNRRSTHSEFGRDMSSEQQQGLRRSKSLTAADRRDLQWAESGADRAAESGRLAPPDHEMYGEGDAKSKSKGWRRFSSILRRKKH